MPTNIEPEAAEWMSERRLSLLHSDLGASICLLRQAGLLSATLGYWVRLQASLDFIWDPIEEKTCRDQLIKQWHIKHKAQNPSITDEQLYSKLRVAPASALWSRQQWGHQLESIYLDRKSNLDRASCRLLRLKDKNLSFELYHRIKAGEMTFEQVSSSFGTGKERFHGGLIPLKPLETMPFGLAPLLLHLKPGCLSMPQKLGDGFCLVQLESFEPSKFDKETEEFLLAERMRFWIDLVVEYIIQRLSS